MNLKLNIFLLLLFIKGGSLLALPINISGIAYNNGSPVIQNTTIYIQGAGVDTMAFTNGTGNYVFNVNPRDTTGVFRVFFLDCKRDTADTNFLFDIRTTNVAADLFGCNSPPLKYYTGSVQLRTGPFFPNQAFLLRYKYLAVDQSFVFEDTLSLDSNSSFKFLNDGQTDYLLKVIPKNDSIGFAPTYYPNGLTWDAENSKAIGPHINRHIIIDLAGYNVPRGRFSISGKVDVDPNLVKAGYSAKGIHLLNDSNEVIEFAYADLLGNFNFKDIDIGTYRIWIDQCGLPTEPVEVTLNQSNSSANEIILTASNLGISYQYFVGLEEAIDEVDISFYPNPFHDQLNIKSISESHLVIYDALGNVIIEKEIIEENETLETYNWKPGIYFLIVENEKGIYRKKIVKAR